MACQQGDVKQKIHADYLEKIGDGQVPTVPGIPGEDNMIRIPDEMKSKETTLRGFCKQIYPGLESRHQSGMKNFLVSDEWDTWLMERSIISATNDACDEINQMMVDMLPGQPFVYHSTDKVLNTTEAFEYPQEFLWKITNGSMPPHTLVLKKGTPVMMLRNLDPANGHVNGSRYVVISMTSKVIHARLATSGPNKGQEIMIPRILFHPKDRTLPFEMERKQFPIRVCFGITSNKSQVKS